MKRFLIVVVSIITLIPGFLLWILGVAYYFLAISAYAGHKDAQQFLANEKDPL